MRKCRPTESRQCAEAHPASQWQNLPAAASKPVTTRLCLPTKPEYSKICSKTFGESSTCLIHRASSGGQASETDTPLAGNWDLATGNSAKDSNQLWENWASRTSQSFGMKPKTLLLSFSHVHGRGQFPKRWWGGKCHHGVPATFHMSPRPCRQSVHLSHVKTSPASPRRQVHGPRLASPPPLGGCPKTARPRLPGSDEVQGPRRASPTAEVQTGNPHSCHWALALRQWGVPASCAGTQPLCLCCPFPCEG